MQVFFELLADRRDHARRSMPHIKATDAASEIEEAVSVHVLDDRAFRLGGKQGRCMIRAAGDGGFTTCHQSTRLWTRNFRANLDRFHFCVPSCGSRRAAPLRKTSTNRWVFRRD